MHLVGCVRAAAAKLADTDERRLRRLHRRFEVFCRRPHAGRLGVMRVILWAHVGIATVDSSHVASSQPLDAFTRP